MSIVRRQCGQKIGNVGSRSGFTTQCYRGAPIAKQKPAEAGSVRLHCGLDKYPRHPQREQR